MANPLQTTLRRYEYLRPSQSQPGFPFKKKELARWIEEDVCPLVRELVVRREFKEAACWSINQLVVGSQSAARRQVEAIDKSVLEIARTISRGLEKAPAGTKVVVLDEHAALANWIAARPWGDLVSVQDYFGVHDQLNLQNGSEGQLADFLPCFNSELHLPGDFVTRGMLLRIEFWHDQLKTLLGGTEAILRLGLQGEQSVDRCRALLKDVSIQREYLRAATLLSDEGKRCEACMTLVQILAAFDCAASLPGWDDEVVAGRTSAARLHYYVSERADEGITDQIAAALDEVAPIYEASLADDGVLQARINDTPLVLVYGPGHEAVHWQGARIDFDVTRFSRDWTLLVALAQNALRSQGVDQLNDLGISLKDAKYRLKKILPPDLWREIKPRKGGYQLELSPDQVFVAEMAQMDQLIVSR